MHWFARLGIVLTFFVAGALSLWANDGVTGRNVASVMHNGGSFVNENGGWIEKDVSGRANFQFEERGRDDWSVYVYDRSRDVNLQFDLHRKLILYSTGSNPLSPLYQITSVNAAQTHQSGSVGGGQVNGQNVKSVSHSRGSLQFAEGRWLEADINGQVNFRFDERGRDDWSVYLYDSSRDVNLQLDLYRKEILYSAGNNPLRPLYQITEASANSAYAGGAGASSGAASNPPAQSGGMPSVNIVNNSGQPLLLLLEQNGSQTVLGQIEPGQRVSRGFPSGTVIAVANASGSAFVGQNYTVSSAAQQPLSLPYTGQTGSGGGTVVNNQGGGAQTPPPPRGSVTAHQHCNYGGYSATIPEGRHSIGQLQAMGARNDDISSLRVPQGWEVTIYSDAGFQGNSRKLVSNTDCLVNAGMNDVISSIVVERRGTTTNPEGAARNNSVLSDADIKKVADTLIATIIKTQLDAQNRPAACWRDSYGRGVGKIPDCGPNQEKSGLLCYNKCKASSSARSNANYKNVAGVCWQQCPSGYRNDGAFCRKNRTEYGRGAGFPWKFGDGLNDSGMYKRCEARHGRG